MVDRATGQDQRAFPRLPASVGIEIVRPESFTVMPISGSLKDVSQNGALIETAEQLEEGEWIILRPEYAPEGDAAEITAIVERRVDAGESGEQTKYACRFPIPIDYARLQSFL